MNDRASVPEMEPKRMLKGCPVPTPAGVRHRIDVVVAHDKVLHSIPPREPEGDKSLAPKRTPTTVIEP